MIKYYQDYYWKRGRPCGIHPVVDAKKCAYSYKIVSDPYHKRYSIEKYRQGLFEKTIYDSLLLDFRYLIPMEQAAWEKESLYEDSEKIIS